MNYTAQMRIYTVVLNNLNKMPYETRFIIFFLKYDFLNELNVKLNIIHFLGENKKQEIYFQSSRINVLK